PEKMLESVKLLWAHDWRVIRAMPLLAQRPASPDLFEPRDSIPITAQALIGVREAVGGELMLGLDYHHRLSLAETASFCQRLPSATLDFIEEPIRDESPETYAALRRLTNIPFAVGEEFSSKWQFLPYLERHLTDYVRLAPC